jgi:hypothetical protein
VETQSLPQQPTIGTMNRAKVAMPEAQIYHL